MRGILKAENEIKQFNFRIVNFLFELYDEEEFIEEANKIMALNLQGVVIAPVFINETKKNTAKLDQANIPYVFINSDIQGENRICFVGQDSYAGG